MRMIRFLSLLTLTTVLPLSAARADVLVSAQNELKARRVQETVEVPGAEIAKLLSVTDVRRIRVTDAGSGQQLVAQSLDFDGDGSLDLLIFQSDFEPGQVKKFRVSQGDRQHPTKDQFKAYGRFVRERFDDFAWENDRIAHRMYGPALETWQREPLTSSAVDIWCKRTPRLVINDWYMADDYHADTGEGADFYSAGKSRGVGGSGIWEDNQLFVSRNFMDSKMLANGPIRVVFELIYAPWVVKGRRIAETKRISLDAGQNLNRFESLYLLDAPRDVSFAAGIKKQPQATVEFSQDGGFIRTWEPVSKQDGFVGGAIVALPNQKAERAEDQLNYLLVMQAGTGQPGVYYAGFGWDKAGQFRNAQEWDDYLRGFSERLKSPLKITLSAEN